MATDSNGVEYSTFQDKVLSDVEEYSPTLFDFFNVYLPYNYEDEYATKDSNPWHQYDFRVTSDTMGLTQDEGTTILTNMNDILNGKDPSNLPQYQDVLFGNIQWANVGSEVVGNDFDSLENDSSHGTYNWANCNTNIDYRYIYGYTSPSTISDVNEVMPLRQRRSYNSVAIIDNALRRFLNLTGYHTSATTGADRYPIVDYSIGIRRRNLPVLMMKKRYENPRITDNLEYSYFSFSKAEIMAKPYNYLGIKGFYIKRPSTYSTDAYYKTLTNGISSSGETKRITIKGDAGDRSVTLTGGYLEITEINGAASYIITEANKDVISTLNDMYAGSIMALGITSATRDNTVTGNSYRSNIPHLCYVDRFTSYSTTDANGEGYQAIRAYIFYNSNFSTYMTNLSTNSAVDKWECIYCDGLYPINEAVGIEVIKTLSAQGNGITTTSDFNASAKGTGMQSEKDKNKAAVIKAAREESMSFSWFRNNNNDVGTTLGRESYSMSGDTKIGDMFLVNFIYEYLPFPTKIDIDNLKYVSSSDSTDTNRYINFDKLNYTSLYNNDESRRYTSGKRVPASEMNKAAMLRQDRIMQDGLEDSRIIAAPGITIDVSISQ